VSGLVAQRQSERGRK